MQETYDVYVMADAQGRVMQVISSAFLADAAGWVAIDSGAGDRYRHAQGNYLPGPLQTQRGVPRYRLDGAQVIKRTAEEIAADEAALPAPAPTPAQRCDALEAAFAALMGGIEDVR